MRKNRSWEDEDNFPKKPKKIEKDKLDKYKGSVYSMLYEDEDDYWGDDYTDFEDGYDEIEEDNDNVFDEE